MNEQTCDHKSGCLFGRGMILNPKMPSTSTGKSILIYLWQSVQLFKSRSVTNWPTLPVTQALDASERSVDLRVCNVCPNSPSCRPSPMAHYSTLDLGGPISVPANRIGKDGRFFLSLFRPLAYAVKSDVVSLDTLFHLHNVRFRRFTLLSVSWGFSIVLTHSCGLMPCSSPCSLLFASSLWSR